MKPQNQNEKSENKTQQVRGPALRDKIAESKEYGEQYRADHQGSDIEKPAGSQDRKEKSVEQSPRRNK